MKLFPLILLPFVSISCTFSSADPDTYEAGFMKRAELLTEQIAGPYKPPHMGINDPQKYYWPKAMARFEKFGSCDSLANAWVDTLSGRPAFHFTLVGMSRLLSRYPDAPAIERNRDRILKHVFERVDSHNAWTGEGTENHTNMARTSGLIHAQEALNYPDLFPEAEKRYAQMKEWVLEWSRSIYSHGTGEFNSSIYQAYSVISWLNLFDFASDPEIKAAARAVLDYYAAETALHYSWGSTGGSEMRGNGARNVNTTATNYLAWLWFGDSSTDSLPFTFRGSQYIQCIHAVTSSYRVPPEIRSLARKGSGETGWYQNSKPEYLFSDLSFVKQFYFIGDGFTLGSCNSAYGGWTGTTVQVVPWRLVIAPDTGSVPYEIGGNGRFYDLWNGRSVNPYTQNFQHRNTLIQLTRTPEDALDKSAEIISTVENWKTLWKRDFNVRFPMEPHKGKTYQIVNYVTEIANENRSFISFPASAKSLRRGDLFCLEIGRHCLGIRVIGEVAEDSLVTVTGNDSRGRRYLIAEADPGNYCGFVMEVFPQHRFSCLECFADQMEDKTLLDLNKLSTEGTVAYSNLDGESLHMQYSSSGSFSEATVDWGFGPVEPASLLSEMGFRQPDWPSGAGYGRLPLCSVNGKPVDFEAVWPVFEGPGMTLSKGILRVGSDEAFYKVDYSGHLPHFSTAL